MKKTHLEIGMEFCSNPGEVYEKRVTVFTPCQKKYGIKGDNAYFTKDIEKVDCHKCLAAMNPKQPKVKQPPKKRGRKPRVVLVEHDLFQGAV